MKVIAIITVMLCGVNIAAATWFGLWGYIWCEKPGINFEGVYVQAESQQGNSAIVQSYVNNQGDTQYDMDGGSEIPTGRYYYRVHAWKGTSWDGENTNGFYFTGGSVQRDVILHAIAK